MSTSFDLLSRYYQMYRVPDGMLEHGMELINTVIDMDNSTSDTLVLSPNTTHLLTSPYLCENMVYLLINRAPETAESQVPVYQASNVSRIDQCLVYAGQTVGFSHRESSRTGRMKESDIKICLQHNLSQYQKDCLETIVIAFLLLQYGSRCDNKSPYPRFVYRDIPSGMLIGDVLAQSQLIATNTFALLRRALIVGSAPPQRLSDQIEYRELIRLQRETNPVLDWQTTLSSSESIKWLMDFLSQSDRDNINELPPFVDHYPDQVSDKIDKHSAMFDLGYVKDKDNLLVSTVQRLQKNVVVMLGARRTLLHPSAVDQRRSLYTKLCGNLYYVCVSRTKFRLLLWWPHLGFKYYGSNAAKLYLEAVYNLLCLQLQWLCWELEISDIDNDGLTFQQVESFRLRYSDHPVNPQLQELLVKLSGLVSVSMENANVPNVIFASLAVSNEGVSRVEPGPEEDLAIVDEVVDEVVDEDVNEIMDEDEGQGSSNPVQKLYTKGQETRFLLATKKRVPTYDFLSHTEKASELQITIKLAMTILKDKGVEKAIKSGGLSILENEPMEKTRLRYKEWLHQHWLTKSFHVKAELSTCCDCGQFFNKTFNPKGQIKVVGHPSRCKGRNLTLTLGWSAVRGNWSSDFPQNNIFHLFLWTLPPNTGINMFQIAAAFASYVRDNEEHPQSKELAGRFQEVFDAIESLQKGSGTAQGSLMTAWKLGLGRALDKLQDVFSIKVLQRDSFPQEKTHWGSKTKSVQCRIFSPFEGETSFVEDMDYLGYRQKVRLPPQTETLLHLERPTRKRNFEEVV
ncbi:unnamed protein product [Umbelopsis ramanniana]